MSATPKLAPAYTADAIEQALAIQRICAWLVDRGFVDLREAIVWDFGEAPTLAPPKPPTPKCGVDTVWLVCKECDRWVRMETYALDVYCQACGGELQTEEQHDAAAE